MKHVQLHQLKTTKSITCRVVITHFFILASFFLFQLELQGQQKKYDLKFNFFNETYRPVSTDSSFNLVEPNEPWTHYSTLPSNFIGFDYILGNDTLTHFTLNMNGGMMFYPELCDGDLFAGMILEWRINDRNYLNNNSLSPIYRAIQEDTNGNKRLVIEWRYAATGNSYSDSVNFQVILYEEGNKLEYRFGKINYSGDWNDLKTDIDNPGPLFLAGLTADCDNSENNLYYFLHNEENDPQPKLSSIREDGNWDQFVRDHYLQSPPNPGDVWQFTLEERIDNHAADNTKNIDLKVFPNPSNNGQFHISLKDDIINMNVFSLHTGREIHFRKTGGNRFTLNRAKPGIYLLQIETPAGIYREKLVISH